MEQIPFWFESDEEARTGAKNEGMKKSRLRMKVEAYRGSAVEQLLFVVSLPLVDSAWVVSTYTHYRHSLISPTLLICLSRFPPQARLVSHHR